MLPLYSGCPRGSKPYRKCSTVCHPCKWPEWFWGASSFLYASPPSVARTGLERGPGGAVRRRLALFPISSPVECGLKGCNVGAGLAPALVPAPAPVPARPLPLSRPCCAAAGGPVLILPLILPLPCPCPGPAGGPALLRRQESPRMLTPKRDAPQDFR
jgi:hypothetical protein